MSVATTVTKPMPTRDGYGIGLARAGRADPMIVALDADLAESTRSKWFGEEFPDRFFQMGISEQDMVGTAAGLAAAGYKPFASTFAVFSERAFEFVRNAVARPNLDVKIVGSHGGVQSGEDGSSAHAIEDVAVYRSLPNMRVVVPADAIEAASAVEFLAANAGPAYLRLTRTKVPLVHGPDHRFVLGRWDVLRPGHDVAILACGALVEQALAAASLLEAEGVSARVVNASSIKPLDLATLLDAARGARAIVTAEDHSVVGGLGGAVCEALAEHAPTVVERVGIQDTFTESGTPAELYEKYGLTAAHVAKAARRAVARKA